MKALFYDLLSNFSCICTKLTVNDEFSVFSFLIDRCRYIHYIFGYKAPSFFSVYLKGICTTLIMMAVFGFVFAWMMKAKPHRRPLRYIIIIFDVCGTETKMDGMRTEFKTHDVAWSFMKEYKKFYPLFNFALVSDLPNSDKMTIFRYL